MSVETVGPDLVETNGHSFRDPITSVEELRRLLGEPSEVARTKQRPALDRHSRAFIERSPFVALGTADAQGRCDVAPKGDAPGFVRVLDDHTLVIPDRPGNRRFDSLANLIANPRVGLLFLIPGVEETLRVNGRARLVRDPVLLDRLAMNGKQPWLAIVVTVEEAYLHCARAFKRARLWDTASWRARSELPTLARMLMDQTHTTSCTLDELEQRIAQSNQNLY